MRKEYWLQMKDLIKKARFVFICGNGGSSATAEHLASDLFSKGIKAICLNSNTSIMTMIANDFGYQYVFSKQLGIYANKNDLLITISCSGKSPNIVNAIMTADLMGIKHFEFETFKDNRDYEALENKHLILAHEIKKKL